MTIQSHCEILDLLLPSVFEVAAYQIEQQSLDQSARLKRDGTTVTDVDVASENMIVETLVAAFPGTLIIAEESQEREATAPDLDRRAFFLVDALDGTSDYRHGGKDFTINVALVENAAVAFGLVFAAAHEVAYWGIRGQGAFRAETKGGTLANIEKISVKPEREPLIFLSKSRGDSPEIKRYLADLNDPATEQLGSSLKTCRVAEGIGTHYPCYGDTYEWDTAAAQCVLEEAGGWVRPIGGGQLLYGKSLGRRPFLNPGFVASAR